MKKSIFIVFILLAVSRISLAQTTPAINNSYTTQNSSLIVNPYDPATGTPDMKLHFLLNANTKFYISKILDGGYVIRVWHFSDKVKVNYKDRNNKQQDSVYYKKEFYDKIALLGKAKIALAKAIAHQDSVKKDSAATQKKMVETTSKAKTASTKLNVANKNFDDAKTSLSKEIASTTNKKSSKPTNNASLVSFNKELATKTNNVAKAKTALDLHAASLISSASVQIDTAELQKKIADLEDAKATLDTQTTKLNSLKISKQQSSISTARNQVLKYKVNIDTATKEVKKSYLDLADIKNNALKIEVKLDSARKKIINANKRIESLKDIGGQRSNLPPNDTVYRMYKASVNTYTDTIVKVSQSPAAVYDSLAFVDSWGNYMQFFLPLKNFSDCVQIYPYNDHFTWGFLSVPLKIRVAPFSFEQNVNFGLTFGWKFQPVSTVNVSDNILMGISVGSVNLKADPSSPTVATPTTAAISFSLGYMFQYDKFQAGAFIGWDIAGQNRSQFVNGNTPWIGIAIGLSLFGENSTSAATQNQGN